VSEGFELVVAAGGDGTVNEVLNGIGDIHDGFDRVCLGVLPLGTVNVFARELGIPSTVWDAWKMLLHEHEICIDLPCVEHSAGGEPQRRYFVQMAGAGLDARAVELVNWPLKKKTGPLAYMIAGLKALPSSRYKISAAAGHNEAGELVLVGNGRLYGGRYEVFPGADMRDGLLDVCVFPRVNWLTLARCAPGLLLWGKLPAGAVRRFQAASFTLTGSGQVPFEVDGELAGNLPATFSVQPAKLRVIAP
jgi:YegS/Rv2252/BmrU family lipid kinase